jgi:hypothetical protein
MHFARTSCLAEGLACADGSEDSHQHERTFFSLFNPGINLTQQLGQDVSFQNEATQICYLTSKFRQIMALIPVLG